MKYPTTEGTMEEFERLDIGLQEELWDNLEALITPPWFDESAVSVKKKFVETLDSVEPGKAKIEVMDPLPTFNKYVAIVFDRVKEPNGVYIQITDYDPMHRFPVDNGHLIAGAMITEEQLKKNIEKYDREAGMISTIKAAS